MSDKTETTATRRSVLVSIAVNLVEAIALCVAASVTGSVALRAQTAANGADLAVALFLYAGVLSGGRPSDDDHPLGHGRERFFWSLFAALGIFVGGAGLALDEALRSAVHPESVESYPVAYLVLAVTIALDVLSLLVGLKPLRKQAVERAVSLKSHLVRNTDPALTTVVVGGACAVLGGLIAAIGLVLSQTTGSYKPDTAASAVIGLLLLVTSVFLLNTNRELLTGRGVQMGIIREMRRMIASQPGIVDVPDLFAMVVGPSSFIVNGDVTFADELNVPAVEQAIASAALALRERWPAIEYVYLTPVSLPRPRRVRRTRRKRR